jgi:hypothetical protein
MFVITQAMIDAGNRVLELVTDAGIIESFDGLGGGLKIAEAPPEIAQWFDNDREVSDIIFEAMDALSEDAYRNAATPDMILAGDHVLESLISARFYEASMPVLSQKVLDMIPEQIKTMIFHKESTVGLVYSRMRAVGAGQPVRTKPTNH